jgi:hypothetical protein
MTLMIGGCSQKRGFAFFSSTSRLIGVTLPVPWQASQSLVRREAGG